jgi:hypothetical protein
MPDHVAKAMLVVREWLREQGFMVQVVRTRREK